MLAAICVQELVLRRPPELPAEVRAWRASLSEGRPALRGFRAPVLEESGTTTPIALPDDAVSRRAASLVARGLAREGLLATTAAAIEALRADREEVGLEDLRAIGLPVDLLEYFHAPGAAPAGAEAVVSAIRAKEELAFTFRPSVPGFEVATESGEHPIGTVRAQLTSGTYWTGPGDGGCLDLLRQLLDALPEARFVASIEEAHLASLEETVRDWPESIRGRLVVVPEALAVAQWAQDAGKPGRIGSGAGSGDESVTLVPRYASRGEDGAPFVPGETFLVDGFAAAGLRAAQSPLLFQGGDLLAARDPKDGSRILFLGEANVWRNRALGLSEQQAIEAFRVEFGVDRCVVLPAVSFHVDQEVTLRGVGDRLVAFVADPLPAAVLVLRCSLDAVAAAGVLDPASAAKAREDLDAGRHRDFLARLLPAVGARNVGYGRLPQSMADAFSTGEADSGVGNLQRFLYALDRLTSWVLPVDEVPLDPHSIAYLRSFRRQDDDRGKLLERLRAAGAEIALVPSLPGGDRGIDFLNGIHEPGRYLMPSWGGLFAPLDRAAEEAFRRGFGPGIEVLPILTGESQRRGGAVHCSISALPGKP